MTGPISVPGSKQPRSIYTDSLLRSLQDMVDYTLYDPTAVSGTSEDEHSIQAQLTKILVGAIDQDVDKKAAGSVYTKHEGNRQNGAQSTSTAPTAPPPSYQRATSSRWYK